MSITGSVLDLVKQVIHRPSDWSCAWALPALILAYGERETTALPPGSTAAIRMVQYPG